MRFRLRYLQHNLELPPGQFVIGRSTDCQLSLDDPLVSRRHARLLVTDDAVYVEDLGSRNGVLVGGVRIDGRKRLDDGDRVTVGSQAMTVLDANKASGVSATRAEGAAMVTNATLTIGALPTADVHAAQSAAAHALAAVQSSPAPHAIVPPPEPSSKPSTDDASRRADALRVLGGVANKALALGRAEEAERILQARLQQVLDETRDNPRKSPIDVVDQASRLAAKLAGATGKGAWVDYVVELYLLQYRPLPAPLVDELYSVLRKTTAVDLRVLRDYVEQLRERSGAYGPADRFLLQRIEGLERLAAAK